MKILIVDDHSYNRELLGFILEDEGYACVEAENGQVAIDMFAKDSEIELILMDVNMPVMDGMDATRGICEIKGDRFVTIIFVTALDNPEVLVQCLEAGGDDFVPKPVNEEILLSKVKAHARNQQTFRRLHEAHGLLKVHQRSIDRDHSIVEHVFKSALDRTDTHCVNLKSYTSPMSMFNGDLVLSAPSPSGGEYVLIGDFTGHGLSAAIGSLPVISSFYSHVAKQSSISELVVDINQQLHRLLPIGMFFCACVIHLDKSGKSFSIWSGGMSDALLIDPEGKVTALPGDHMPLGILSAAEFDETVRLSQVPSGSRLLVYTDGVNEAKNNEGQEYGDARIMEVAKKVEADLIPALIKSVREFRGNDDQDDDISIIELRCAPCKHRDKKTNKLVDVAASYHNAECFPWRLDMKLFGEDLKRADVVQQVVSFLGTIQGVELHQDKLFTIVSELYNNSLEHGVLRLESKLKDSPQGFEQYYQLRESRLKEADDQFVEINIEYLRGEPNCVKLVMTDSGDGFDYENKQKELSDSDDSHGRGLGLLDSLLASMEYSNGGRTVTAIYNFS